MKGQKMKKEKKLKPFRIGVLKFKVDSLLSQDTARQSFLDVQCIDEIDAILKHDKKFKFYHEVDEYLIMDLSKNHISNYSIAKRN